VIVILIRGEAAQAAHGKTHARHSRTSHFIRALNVIQPDYSFPLIFTIECLIYE